MFVNKKGQVLVLSDIPLSWLCHSCRTLISDYCHAAKKVDSVLMDPASNSILASIMQHARITKNRLLGALYKNLSAMIQAILNQSENKNRVIQLFKKSRLFVQDNRLIELAGRSAPTLAAPAM
jgi:hypothetical protein